MNPIGPCITVVSEQGQSGLMNSEPPNLTAGANRGSARSL